jgi:hypothetical protein
MKQFYFLSVLIILTFTACNSPDKKLLDNTSLPVDLLIGTWYNSQSGTYEKWQNANNLYFGKAFIIESRDTIVYETLEILKSNGNVYYEATVKNQNDGKPIRFKLVSSGDNKLTFANPYHDFPTKITYHFIEENRLQVTIVGIEEELEKEIVFKFNKVKEIQN